MGHGLGLYSELMAKPTKYKPQYCDELIEHMAKGGHFRGFCGTVSVCEKTGHTWLDKHDEFKEAYGIAKSRCYLWWERLLLSKIVSHKDDTQLNTTAWIFTMKNLFGWRDRHDIEQTTKATVHDPEVLRILSEHSQSLLKASK